MGIGRIPDEVDDLTDLRNRKLLSVGPSAGDTALDRKVRWLMAEKRRAATGDGRWVPCSCGNATCINASIGLRCRGSSL